MSDAPVAAPAPSAPAASPAAPAGGAPATPHHAALQPRTPQGQFNGAPDPTKVPAATAPPAPSWKVDGREFKDPTELAAYAAEQRAEAKALDEYRRTASDAQKRAAEAEAKTKNLRGALTPEDRQAILQEEIRAFQEQERLAAMPENERRLYLFHQQVQREKAALEAEKAERARLDKETADKAKAEADAKEQAAIKEEFKEVLATALEMASLPPTTYNYQRLLMVVRGAHERGVTYPPEVLARKVKVLINEERRDFVKSADPESLLRDLPELVEKLNAVKDPALLRQLAPLGELLRRLNLESLGAKPVTTPTPVSTGAGLAPEANLPPGDPGWAKEFKRRAKG